MSRPVCPNCGSHDTVGIDTQCFMFCPKCRVRFKITLGDTMIEYPDKEDEMQYDKTDAKPTTRSNEAKCPEPDADGYYGGSANPIGSRRRTASEIGAFGLDMNAMQRQQASLFGQLGVALNAGLTITPAENGWIVQLNPPHQMGYHQILFLEMDRLVEYVRTHNWHPEKKYREEPSDE